MNAARPADAPPGKHRAKPRWPAALTAAAIAAALTRVLRRRAARNPPPDGHP